MTVALVKAGPISSPSAKQIAVLVIRGDAMQKLAGDGPPSAARVQQLPGVAVVSVQVPVAESQTLPGAPGVPLTGGPWVHWSAGSHAQATPPRLQQPTGPGASCVELVDVVGVVVVDVVGGIVVVGTAWMLATSAATKAST